MTDSEELSSFQQRVLAYGPKPSALLSFFSSVYIIWRVLSSKRRRSKVFHRIMLGLSINTMILSISYFCGTWMMPVESMSTIHGAMGSVATCTIQGFSIIYGVLNVSIYYSSLSVLSFLVIRNNFNEAALRKFEISVHLTALITSTAVAVLAAYKDTINPAGAVCWMETLPPRCYLRDGVDCIRGGSELVTVGTIYFFVFISAVLFAHLMMLAVYIYMIRVEKRNANVVGKKQFLENARKLKSRMIAKQLGLYLIVYFLTTLPSVISRILQVSSKNEELHYPSYVAGIIIFPLTGVKNLIVYILLSPKRDRNSRAQKASLNPEVADDKTLKPSFEKDWSSVPHFSATATNPVKSNRNYDSSQRKQSQLEKIRRSSCPEFSIFDGSNPSSERWGAFIDERGEDEECKTGGLDA